MEEVKGVKSTKQKTKTKNFDTACFSKKQLLMSKEFSNRKDLINALVKTDEKLTKSELQKRIDDYMKGSVR